MEEINVAEIMDHIIPDVHHRDIISGGEKFEDKEFPGTIESLAKEAEAQSKYTEYTWKHADDIYGTDNYEIMNEVDPNDINQGELGDCYFLCSIAAVAEYPERIKRIFLTESVNKSDCYAIEGFVNGRVQPISMDAMFPYNERGRCPAFATTKGKELWVMLLEKAWAKVNGSYNNIVAGNASNALSFLTGAPTITIDHKEQSTNQIWKQILTADQSHFIMCASAGKPGVSQNEYKQSGLISSHAYSLLQAKEVNSQGMKERLLQIRNPWGSQEWIGDWSDSSPLWTPELKKECKLEAKDDGIFWIRIEDYLKYYGNTTICKYVESYKRAVMECHVPNEQIRLFKFKITSPTKGFISVHQLKERMMRLKYPEYEYSAVTLMLAKEDSESGKYVFVAKGTGSRYICDLEFPGVLEAGNYIAFLQVMWRFKGLETMTLSTYTDNIIEFEGEGVDDMDIAVDILATTKGKDVKLTQFKFQGKTVDIKYIVLASGHNNYCIWINNTQDRQLKGEFNFQMHNMRFTEGDGKVDIDLGPAQKVLRVMTVLDPKMGWGYGAGLSYYVA